MISRFNERIILTLNKNLIKEVKKHAKKEHKTASKFVNELLASAINIYKQDQFFKERTPEEEKELQETIRICKTPWLDDPEDISDE